MNRPSVCFMASAWAAREFDAIRSATPSACARSILPFIKARRVNSPGSAVRAPHSISRLTISRCIHREPWQDISATSSPVNERGALKTVTTDWSSASPFESTILPRWAVCVTISSGSFPRQHLERISKALRPESLITAIPPVPGAVETATIVSSLIIVCSIP